MNPEPIGWSLTTAELTLVRVCLKGERIRELHYSAGLNPVLGDNAYLIQRSKRRAQRIKDLLTSHFPLPLKPPITLLENDPAPP